MAKEMTEKTLWNEQQSNFGDLWKESTFIETPSTLWVKNVLLGPQGDQDMIVAKNRNFLSK